MKNDASVDSKMEPEDGENRRDFLGGAGRFALATAPTVALLLASGGSKPAWASGGGKGNNGFGNGGGDGSPNGKSDVGR